jgi:cardiolipin synthase
LFLQERDYPGLANWTYAVFALAILTDLVDGMVARLRREKTRLGSFLDPVADKLLILSAFTLLAYDGKIAVWVLVILFFRELIIILGWVILYILTSSSAVHPRVLGKTSTMLQMSSAIALLFPVPYLIQLWLVRIMITFTVISAIDYIWACSKRLEPIPDMPE